MPLLPSKKLVFIHIPKTGGQAIYSALGGDLKNPNANKSILWGPDADYEYSHFTAAEIKAEVTEEIFKDYYKFCMVRNPFDRLVSLYHHKVSGPDDRFVKAQGLSFESFVRELSDNFHRIPECRQIDIAHVRPQYEYVYDENGVMLVDHIFKYEQFEEIQVFIKAYGGHKLKRINTTDHEPYQYYYNEATISLVEKMYHRDLKRFGYEFDPT